MPSPSGWPNDSQRVDADGKYQTHRNQHHTQILDPICFAHRIPLKLLARILTVGASFSWSLPSDCELMNAIGCLRRSQSSPGTSDWHGVADPLQTAALSKPQLASREYSL